MPPFLASSLGLEQTALRMALVAAALLLLLAVLRVWQRRRSPDAEVVRKMFHIGGGAIALALPWLFDAVAPVLALGAAMLALFALLRFVPALRAGPGQVLLAVRRETVGEFCYVAALVLLFWAAAGERLLYSVAVMVLAVADTVAALVGVRWGRTPFVTAGGHKTVEGSAAFLAAAFLSAYLPFTLWSGLGQAECWLIALNMALLATIVEAIAWRGFDNLVLPLFALALLQVTSRMGAGPLASHLAILVLVGALAHAGRRGAPLAEDGLLGTVLGGYFFWTLADWRWALAPVVAFTIYSRMATGGARLPQPGFHAPVVAANFAAPSVWLLLNVQAGGGRAFLLPFVAAFAANLAAIAVVRFKVAGPQMPWWWAVPLATLTGAMVVVPPLVASDGLGLATLGGSAACIAAVAVSTAAFYAIQPRLSDFPVDTERWLRQITVTLLASALLLALPAAGA